jgi:hypothetical protein
MLAVAANTALGDTRGVDRDPNRGTGGGRAASMAMDSAPVSSDSAAVGRRDPANGWGVHAPAMPKSPALALLASRAAGREAALGEANDKGDPAGLRAAASDMEPNSRARK